MTVDWQLVLTTDDPGRAARFWRAALGYVSQPPPPGHRSWDEYARAAGIDLVHGRDVDAVIDPTRRRPRLLFVRDDPTERGGISIELLTRPGTSPAAAGAELGAHALRLVGHGATRTRVVDDGRHAWVELRDPDDRPFRLL